MGIALSEEKIKSMLPSTRYQGSKRQISPWIYENLKNLDFDTVLDGFGGTGSVSYLFKLMGKKVTFNDILLSNYQTGVAVIENNGVMLSEEDIEYLLHENGFDYPSFIQENFGNIYYLDGENKWLDIVIHNIYVLSEKYEGDLLKKKQALAFHILFQVCLAKRPYNLFHRKNLYMRTSDVERTFGNKATWDTPFEDHFLNFVNEINECIFSNGKTNKALNLDVFDVEGDFDLVYIDTPYISREGVGVDYLEFYHFLEGIVNYPTWKDMIDYGSKHRRIKHDKPIWCDKNRIHTAFDELFKKFQNSILVVSYRSDGIPSISELERLLERYKGEVKEVRYKEYKYVLSNNRSEECLLIGLD